MLLVFNYDDVVLLCFLSFETFKISNYITFFRNNHISINIKEVKSVVKSTDVFNMFSFLFN